ncbi:MAG TPA: adenosylcobinamide-GDP ribazoletransferase [Actinobacteria bacterium]|nr:adenosylcobinamide-GDP ribazoletransferase [Actinomycetota bacterium]
MRSFLLALGFLSIVPSPKLREDDLEKLGGSMFLFPLVGALLGSILVLFFVLCRSWLSGLFLDSLLIMLLVIFTRALHLDGLADTFDATLGGRDRAEVLRIMEASGIGAFGVLSLIFVILLKVVLLNSLNFKLKPAALVLAPVFGRWAMVFGAAFFSPAKKEGLGYLFARHTGPRQFLIASVPAFAIAFLCLKWYSSIVILSSLSFVAVLAYSLVRKVGGVSGDILGALSELSEVWILFAMFLIFGG